MDVGFFFQNLMSMSNCSSAMVLVGKKVLVLNQEKYIARYTNSW